MREVSYNSYCCSHKCNDFSPSYFKIFHLSEIFSSLTVLYLGVISLCVYSLVFVVLLKCVSRSASSFWKIWDYQLFKYFSFSSFLVFVTLITLMLTELILFHRSLILLLFLIYFFSVLQLDR